MLIDTCSWNSPGVNPYQGQPAAAVESYTQIPKATRKRLKARLAARQFEDVAKITRDSIVGKQGEYVDLRYMHFGKRQVCVGVDRSGWSDRMAEIGLIYCEDGHCIIVPTVCRNVSLVTRVKPLDRAQASAGGPGGPLAPLVISEPLLAPFIAPEAPPALAPLVTQPEARTLRLATGETPPSRFFALPPSPTPFLPPPPLPVVPEPPTLYLMGLALLGLFLAIRRRKQRRESR